MKSVVKNRKANNWYVSLSENFEAIRPVLEHVLEKCQGDTRPCVRLEVGETV